MLAARRLFRGEGAQPIGRHANDGEFHLLHSRHRIRTFDTPGVRRAPSDTMDETIAENLNGYHNDGPVRIGNAVVTQTQHDTYGSIILAATPMFFDRRLPRQGDKGLFDLLETLGAKAAALAFTPDAGIWEYRGRTHIHTYSAAMCWAGCSRLAAIASHLDLSDRAAHWTAISDGIQGRLLEEAWSDERGAFTAALGDNDLDASVLLLPELGLIEPTTLATCARSG